MDATTFSNSRVRETIDSKYVPVKINPDDDRTTPAKYNVNGIPAVFVTDPDGKVLDQVVGFVPPDSFMQLLTKHVKG